LELLSVITRLWEARVTDFRDFKPGARGIQTRGKYSIA